MSAYQYNWGNLSTRRLCMHARILEKKLLGSLIYFDKISMVWERSCMQPNHLLHWKPAGSTAWKTHNQHGTTKHHIELFCTPPKMKRLSTTIPNAKLIKIPRVFEPMFQLGPGLDHMPLKVHWNTALMAHKSLWYQYVTSESMLISCMLFTAKKGNHSQTGESIILYLEDRPFSYKNKASESLLWLRFDLGITLGV